MDTDFTTTQERYARYLHDAPQMIRQTLTGVSPADISRFNALLASKKRLFFTGVGSSMPAAWHGATRLRDRGMPAQFLPTGAVLGMQSLGADDAVILSSQGVNRADALLIIKAALRNKAALVLLTANHDPALAAQADLVYYFEPAEEKLFCRPAGVAANYALMEKLCHETSHDDALVAAWQQGVEQKLILPPAKRRIVLSSNECMPVAWNVALALREGSGQHAELFDIETYGHGNYVADLRARQPDDVAYILVSGEALTPSGRSAQRIRPFLRALQVPFVEVQPTYADTAEAGLAILAMIAAYVYVQNQADGYNMNRPTGKEENRYYHELNSYSA